VPWHCLGVAQQGEKDLQGIQLKDIVVLEVSASVSKQGRQIVLHTTHSDDEGQTDAALAARMYSILWQLGFHGSEDYLVMTCGFFYPQWPIVSSVLLVLWASTTITWRVAVPRMAIVLVEG
jgi:hypothetical protein